MARMARRTIRHAIWSDVSPPPAAAATGEGRPSPQLDPRAALRVEPISKRAGPDVADRERPEHRPRHLVGDRVEAFQQARHASPLAVRFATHVARQRRRHASAAVAMNEDSDRRTRFDCCGLRVEEVKALAVQVFRGPLGAPPQRFGDCRLGCLACRDLSPALDVARRELVTSPWCPLRGANARLLPRIKKSLSGARNTAQPQQDARRR